MGVVADLLAVEDDEHGGETAFDRLDYQTCWGISRVIELHSTPSIAVHAACCQFGSISNLAEQQSCFTLVPIHGLFIVANETALRELI